MRKIRSGGFSAVGVIAVILVIAVLGIAGWSVAQKNSEPEKTNSTNNSSTPQNQSNQPSPTEEDMYLVIKEWGIRITLPEHLRGDISYFINNQAERDFGGPVRVDFLSKKFSAGDLKCAVVEGNSPRTLVTIYKEVDGESRTTQDPQPFKRINDTRYYFPGSTACEEAIIAGGTAQDKQLLADLKASVTNTLENYSQGSSN